VLERPLPLREILADGVEMFCTGTAWTIRHVGEVAADDGSRIFAARDACDAALAALRGIQRGTAADPFGWTHEIEGVA
jgi:hypothetical protein